MPVRIRDALALADFSKENEIVQALSILDAGYEARQKDDQRDKKKYTNSSNQVNTYSSSQGNNSQSNKSEANKIQNNAGYSNLQNVQSQGVYNQYVPMSQAVYPRPTYNSQPLTANWQNNPSNNYPYYNQNMVFPNTQHPPPVIVGTNSNNLGNNNSNAMNPNQNRQNLN